MSLSVKQKNFFDYLANPLYKIKNTNRELSIYERVYAVAVLVVMLPVAVVAPLFFHVYNHWHKNCEIKKLGSSPINLPPNLPPHLVKFENDKKIYPDLFKGPLGGIYNSNFFEVLNCGQPSAISANEFKDKDAIWQQLKINYDAFMGRLKNAPPQDKYTYLIPPKIHLIWLGKEPNDEVKQVKKSWDDFHPTWDVKLWRNEDTEAIITEYRQKYPNVGEAWDNAHTYAEKADIARYCIVHKEGGTYVDTDLPCYDVIDDIHCFSKLCVGMETNKFDRGIIFTGNAWISAEAGHSVIENTIKAVKPYKPNHGNGAWDVLNRTGPGILTNEIYIALEKDRGMGTTDTLVLPPTYPYALPFQMEYNNPAHKRVFEKSKFPWIKGIHLWNSSWVDLIKK